MVLVGKSEGKRPFGRIRLIKRWISRKSDEVQIRDRWRALGNAVMNLRVP
jgi:hypothetical protein